jgi:hypothetical protein
MGNRELDDLLEQLHARLSAAPSVDAEDRRRLAAALREIEAVLAERGDRPPTGHGLEAFALKFEADHPMLAESLRRLADALGKAGI